LPSIYKASSVTVADNAVAIEIRDTANAGKPVSGLTPERDVYLKDVVYRKNKGYYSAEARGEADYIIRNAHSKARLITETAEKETDRLRTEVLESARAQGYDEGFNKGVSDWDKMKREAEQLLFETYAEREAIIKGMEPQMINLVIKILNKLLGDIRINPQIILKLIHEGLSITVGSDGVKLRVSPHDYDYARGHMDNIREYAGSNSVELISDASLKPMDCVIDTAYGSIDSSLDQQFESLKADLLYTLNGAGA